MERLAYVLENRKRKTMYGFTSEYNHKDVGIIVLKPESVQRILKKFLALDEKTLAVVQASEEVFYKGFPTKSAEFHVKRAKFGDWIEFRQIQSVRKRLIKTKGERLHGFYRDDEFAEDGTNLKGISGSRSIHA